MAAHLSIVTGSSRGLGAALAGQLAARGHTVLGLARGTSPHLPAGQVTQWTADLADPAPVAARLAAWLGGFRGTAVDSVTLINNAGVLSRIGPIDETTDDDLARALRVGLEAPLLLTAAFLRATRTWPSQRRVMNVSSGLGRRAMAGSASYCAAKAGLDHFTRCIALDEAGRPHGARIASIAPGVIDTDMQAQLRDSDPAGFPDHGRFVGLSAGGQLATADATAAALIARLDRDDFGADPLGDVRDG